VASQPVIFTAWAAVPGDQRAVDVVELADGTFTLAGVTIGAATNQVAMLRLSSKGQFLGMTTAPGKGLNQPAAMAQMSDGTLVVAGENDHDKDGIWQGLLMRASAQGSPLWQKQYPGTGDSRLSDVVIHAKGDISVVGQTTKPGSAGAQGWLMRVVGFGSVAKEVVVGGQGDDALHGLAAAGEAVVAVGTRAAGASTEGWLLRVEATGKIAWQQYVAVAGKTAARQVAAAGGGWVVAGHRDTGGANSWDPWLMGIDGQGKTMWLSKYALAGPQVPTGLSAGSGGGWVLGGTSTSNGGNSDGWLLATDALGNARWTHDYGGAGTQRGFGVRSLSGGGIALAGYSFNGLGQSDAWLVRTDAWGAVQCAKSGKCALMKASACDDGKVCTNDLCAAGQCKSAPLSPASPCADGKSCQGEICK